MAVLLGLAVALSYGAADFFGGLSTKRASATAVVVRSQLLGLPIVAVLLPLTGGHPTARGLGLGAASGIAGGIGLWCLYRALAGGRMSVVAPITAVGAAVVPVAWGVFRGERPSATAMAGVAIAIVAVALVSRTPDQPPSLLTSLPDVADNSAMNTLAVVAGLAFGMVFVLLGETGPGVGFWPLVAARSTSIVMLGAVAVVARQSLRLPKPGPLPAIAAAGVLDVTANAVYLLATRRGLLALVAVISALYPAGTVLLARVVLHERLVALQVAGLVLAGAGVVLIAAG
ncbi:MAG: hypothetical protein QOF60_1246 [Actinomycetota bacterium]|jgi:drug/metabolite transporter (DMT)-like permease|nr:hypothetical protein [Actinomycetota bacterium]